MSNVETIVKGINEYTDNKYDVEVLAEFNVKPIENAYSVTELIDGDNEEFIKEAGLEKIFDLDDKEIQKKILRKIMYIAYLNGLAENQNTMMMKCMIKMMEDMLD